MLMLGLNRLIVFVGNRCLRRTAILDCVWQLCPKALRPRFDATSYAERLESFEWWHWGDEIRAERLPPFQKDCGEFLAYFEQV
ncbi:phosphonate metabolism protein [Vibrio cyclitrophicus]|uniref:phosphonate metabolism protein n=1 Tax=Vibrio cyclitrophicus TaxID=47951 RepID=UPI00080E47CE|nr:phosphonate metabolism protein [Vibrio cyclitrophicus]OCH40333.1 phosphonate metabolism protein [Vibrio cyclitrophicus]